jgi:hypothetical protein
MPNLHLRGVAHVARTRLMTKTFSIWPAGKPRRLWLDFRQRTDIFLLFEESGSTKGSTELPLQLVPRLFPQATVAGTGTCSWPFTSIRRRDGKMEGTILLWVCAVRRLQLVVSQISVLRNVSRVWFVHRSWTNGEIPDSWCPCPAYLKGRLKPSYCTNVQP